MKIHQQYWLLAITLGLLTLGCRQQAPAVEENKTRPPNILLILTDDQGWGDLSLHGNDSIATPVLDRLGRSSVSFDRFYVSPVCAPTRAALLTGRYHLRTGTSWVTHRKEVMRASEHTLAEYLREAGYVTGCFGKWHNGEQFPNDPAGQGFDEFLGFTAGHWNNYFDTHLLHNGDRIETRGFITDVLTDAAIGFIREHRERPFFCYLPYNAPHSPFQVPDRYFEKYKAKGLSDKGAAVYGMVENIDDNVGRLLTTLDSLGLAGETIVVFLTDNGPNGQRFNGGMKGWKAQVDEGGVRVPCFIRWPGHLPEGKVVKPLAAHFDLLPTLLELGGIEYEAIQPLDGRSLVPLMTEEEPSWPERSIFNIQNDGEDRMYPAAVRTSRYRYVLDPGNRPHLYDMTDDPGQTRDLLSDLPKVADSLHQTLERWYQEVTSKGITLPPIPVGYPASAVVELPAPEAGLHGKLAFRGGRGWANDWITGWGSNEDSANWLIEVAAAGQYIVGVRYCARPPAVSVSLLAESGKEKVEKPIPAPHDPPHLNSPDRIPRGEVYEKEWATLELGTLHLDRGVRELQLRTVGSVPPQALEVKGIYLRKL